MTVKNGTTVNIVSTWGALGPPAIPWKLDVLVYNTQIETTPNTECSCSLVQLGFDIHTIPSQSQLDASLGNGVTHEPPLGSKSTRVPWRVGRMSF